MMLPTSPITSRVASGVPLRVLLISFAAVVFTLWWANRVMAQGEGGPSRVTEHAMAAPVIDGFLVGPLLYQNQFDDQESVRDWVLEGDAIVSTVDGRLRMENVHPRGGEQEANFVFWCPEDFPSDFVATWTFTPKREPGLAITLFGAKGLDGRDLLDPTLSPRSGSFHHYHGGDIRNMWVSYFRHMPEPKPWNIVHVRRNPGLHSVAMGADPIGLIEHGADRIAYRMILVKVERHLRFIMEHDGEWLETIRWHDDSPDGQGMVAEGKIGFRQMAPLIAEYDDFRVYAARLDAK